MKLIWNRCQKDNISYFQIQIKEIYFVCFLLFYNGLRNFIWRFLAENFGYAVGKDYRSKLRAQIKPWVEWKAKDPPASYPGAFRVRKAAKSAIASARGTIAIPS